MSNLTDIDTAVLVHQFPAIHAMHLFLTSLGFELKSPVKTTHTKTGYTSIRFVWRNRKANSSTCITQFIKFKD